MLGMGRGGEEGGGGKGALRWGLGDGVEVDAIWVVEGREGKEGGG